MTGYQRRTLTWGALDTGATTVTFTHEFPDNLIIGPQGAYLRITVEGTELREPTE